MANLENVKIVVEADGTLIISSIDRKPISFVGPLMIDNRLQTVPGEGGVIAVEPASHFQADAGESEGGE